MKKIHHKRPSWFIDAKWFFGIFFTISLAIVLILFFMYKVTAEKPAIETMTKTIAITFSPLGLDDQTEIEKWREEINYSAEGFTKPLEGMSLSLSREDLEGKNPRQVRLDFFERLARPAYENRYDEIISLADSQGLKDELQSIKWLSFLSRDGHRAVETMLLIALIATFVFAIPFIFFSKSFGRLGNPGLVIFLVNFPGVITFLVLSTLSRGETTPTVDNIQGAVGYVLSSLLPSLARDVSRHYVLFFLIGLIMIVMAILGKLIWRLFIPHHSNFISSNK